MSINPNFTNNSLGRVQQSLNFWLNNGAKQINLPWVVTEDCINKTKPAENESFQLKYGHLIGSGEQSFLELWKNDFNKNDEDKFFKANDIYIGWTPCFRDEKEIDKLHHFAFLKSELFMPLNFLWDNNISLTNKNHIYDVENKLKFLTDKLQKLSNQKINADYILTIDYLCNHLKTIINFNNIISKSKENFENLTFELDRALPLLFNISIIDDCSLDINYKNIEIGSYGIRDFNGLSYIYGTILAEPRFISAIKDVKIY